MNTTPNKDKRDNPEPPTKKIIYWVILAVVGIPFIYGVIVWRTFNSWEKSGAFGDTFGLITALFSGIALIGIVYSSILQRRDLKAQQEELKLTRDELRESRIAQ